MFNTILCNNKYDYTHMSWHNYLYYIYTEKYSPKSCVANFDTQMSSNQSEE